MSLDLADLSDETRKAMLDEIEADIAAGLLYISPRLTSAGASDYPELLLVAAETADDHWLANQLAMRMATYELGRSKRGRIYRKKVPALAASTLAEGEFNRFYLRGLAIVAIAAHEEELEIYRAKEVLNPRPESRRMVGRRVSAANLLMDLRTHTGVDTALGLPPGPNSGLSGRRIPE